MIDGVLDSTPFGKRRVGTTDAQIDDARTVIDCVHDGVRFVDVTQRPVGAARLHDHQLRVAAEAGDSVAVRHGTGGERRDEGSVSVDVANVRSGRVEIERTR